MARPPGRSSPREPTPSQKQYARDLEAQRKVTERAQQRVVEEDRARRRGGQG